MKRSVWALAAILLSACATTGGSGAQPSIDGEWAVEAIDGKNVNNQAGFEPAYLGFDGKQIHGSTSCNQLTGSVALDTSKGTIGFASVGCTRMLCHDDEVERALLDALPRIKTYTVKADTLLLSSSQGKTVMRLVKRKN